MLPKSYHQEWLYTAYLYIYTTLKDHSQHINAMDQMENIHQHQMLSILMVLAMTGFLFGYQLYNIDDYVCCNGQLHNRTNNSLDFDCYGSNLCNFRTQRCCGNQTFAIEEAEDYRCCSGDIYYKDVFYNFRTQICCNGEVLDLPTATTNSSDILYYCCENQVYNPMVNACCSGRVTIKEEGIECCGEQKFNSSTEMCCTTHLWPNKTISSASVVPYDPRRPFCCGLQLYNYEEEICCQNKAWRYPRKYNKKYDRVQCCGDHPLYDHRRYICCGQKLLRKTSPTSYCCGDQLYNYRNQSCCGNVVFDLPPDKHRKCCRKTKQLYDDRWQVCCDGTLVLNITEEDLADNRIHCC